MLIVGINRFAVVVVVSRQKVRRELYVKSRIPVLTTVEVREFRQFKLLVQITLDSQYILSVYQFVAPE